MVMPTRVLAFSPEFEKARADLYSAREKYTALVEEYTNLTGVVAKNLETEYMLKIGKKEYELFSCQVEILRVKREIAIFQAARNRGGTVTAEEVQKIIEKEFAEYRSQLEKQKEKLEFARNYLMAKKLTPEENKALKKLYRDIVRKLHPDLNPDLPVEAAIFWEQVQLAYQMNDWQELYWLAEMVDDLLEGKQDPVESIDSLTRLQEESAKIKQKTVDLEKLIADTRKRVPFSCEALLRDPAAVKIKRHELDAQIKLCKAHITELKSIRAQY